MHRPTMGDGGLRILKPAALCVVCTGTHDRTKTGHAFTIVDGRYRKSPLQILAKSSPARTQMKIMINYHMHVKGACIGHHDPALSALQTPND